MILNIIILLVLIFANGVFAMSEIAVVSARKARLQQLANSGKKGARVALRLQNDPDSFLATVQIGITLIGIVAGAYGGAVFSEYLAQILRTVSVEFIAEYAGSIAFLIVVGFITYLSLIIGELVPKRIGLIHAERVATFTAPLMYTLSRCTSPLVWLLSKSAGASMRVLGIAKDDGQKITEEEIHLIVQEGADAGLFEHEEQQMIQRIFQFGDKVAGSIMTPRSDIVWFDMNADARDNWRSIEESGHAYFPVCRGELDNVIGISSTKSLWFQDVSLDESNIQELTTKPLFIHTEMKVLNLLELFKQSKRHLALVVDEYGNIHGLVTPMDILESIVGDVPSLEEADEEMVIPRSDGTWIVDASISLDNFKEAFDIRGSFPAEKVENYHTLAGFILSSLKNIPQTGDTCVWKDYEFEIVDMDGQRIDSVIVSQNRG